MVLNKHFVEYSVTLKSSPFLNSIGVSIPICLVVVQRKNINTINRSDIIKIVYV